MTKVLLVGNPNCGKTTLFNALTGENQRVGNWPGVTVEKKMGSSTFQQQTIYFTDLPGVYSLANTLKGFSQDEQITSQAVIRESVDLLINVIDACHLERHLYLTSQLLELGKPLIIALNMTDIAAQRGIIIDVAALAARLGCPVIALQAHKKLGVTDLQKAALSTVSPPSPFSLVLPQVVQQQLNQLMCELKHEASLNVGVPYAAHRILEGDTSYLLNTSLRKDFSIVKDIDLILADARYSAIHQVVTAVQSKRSDASEYLTAKLDRIFLHRFWALPIFFAVMYLMFFFAIGVGGAFQDFFDLLSDAVFVQGSAWVLQQAHAPSSLITLVAQGIGKGINTTVTFIPVLTAMYFFLSILEASGYMARAAFVVDKIMRILGLPGKSFIPMIVGFGCNVPAIMSARVLDSNRDRLLTILMSPFMSCSARLAIYAVFVAVFFPRGGQHIVFSLYMIGIFMAVLTGLLLRKTFFQGAPAPLILELPTYHLPSLRRIFKETTVRLRYFIWRAGKFIVPVSVILAGLNGLMVRGYGTEAVSLLSYMGQGLTPLFSPMGLQSDNWPATVGLLSGMLAKEVVIGSLNTLYSQMGQGISPEIISFDGLAVLKTAIASIPQHLNMLFHPFTTSFTEPAAMEGTAYAVMTQYFAGKVGAYAYLLFILLYIPCISTMAAIRQEANAKLMWFSVVWSCVVAYAVAVFYYQCATLTYHPLQSCLWMLAMVVLVMGTVASIKLITVGFRRAYVTAAS